MGTKAKTQNKNDASTGSAPEEVIGESTTEEVIGESTTEEVIEESATNMDEYFNTYPKENVFYRTSDGQVFLSADKQWAAEHQKTLKQGELETINRK